MKRIVIVFGFISGAISSSMIAVTILFWDAIGSDRGLVIGYTTIVASFLLVFFGVRAYRDRVAGGALTFGQAFTVAILITLVSCACYVATWELIYFGLAPERGQRMIDDYMASTIADERAEGASRERIEQVTKEMAEMREMARNPVINAGMTFLEPFPVGLGVSLLSAAVLRRRESTAPTRQTEG